MHQLLSTVPAVMQSSVAPHHTELASALLAPVLLFQPPLMLRVSILVRLM